MRAAPTGIEERTRTAAAGARSSCERARQARSRVIRQRQSLECDAGRRTELVRQRRQLTLPDLWWRYWALGGDADLVDLDGFLVGLFPLAPDQRIILFQALRERRMELDPGPKDCGTQIR